MKPIFSKSEQRSTLVLLTAGVLACAAFADPPRAGGPAQQAPAWGYRDKDSDRNDSVIRIATKIATRIKIAGMVIGEIVTTIMTVMIPIGAIETTVAGIMAATTAVMAVAVRWWWLRRWSPDLCHHGRSDKRRWRQPVLGAR